MIYRNYEISYDPPPIPMRGMDYNFAHVDFDGPEDHRCGCAASVDDAQSRIDEIEGEVE